MGLRDIVRVEIMKECDRRLALVEQGMRILKFGDMLGGSPRRAEMCGRLRHHRRIGSLCLFLSSMLSDGEMPAQAEPLYQPRTNQLDFFEIAPFTTRTFRVRTDVAAGDMAVVDVGDEEHDDDEPECDGECGGGACAALPADATPAELMGPPRVGDTVEITDRQTACNEHGYDLALGTTRVVGATRTDGWSFLDEPRHMHHPDTHFAWCPNSLLRVTARA